MRVLVLATTVTLSVTVTGSLRGQAALGAAVQSIRSAMAAGNHDTAIAVADSVYRRFP
ncbi:MAG TPA: hypothetical protein VFZ73_05085 [Gemmatimonadaceae bacterium]